MELRRQIRHLDVLDDIGRLANVLVCLVVVDHRDERLARWVHVT